MLGIFILVCFHPFLVDGKVISTKGEIFLGDLAINRYPECALFFVRQSEESEIGNNLLSNVVKRVKSSAYYNAVFPKSSSFPAVGNLSAIKFSTSWEHLNRIAYGCKIVVVMVDDFRPEYFQWIKR